MAGDGIIMDKLFITVLYLLQILPEALVCGIALLALLLANPAVFVLAAGAVATQFAADGVGRMLMGVMPDMGRVTSTMDSCVRGHLGKSWARLLSSTGESGMAPMAPSVYMATLSFFAGWGWALQQLYAEEIHAGVVPHPSSIVALTVVTLLVISLAFVFRIYTGCEPWWAALSGVAFGGLAGYLGAIMIGYSSGRKATNLWGIPLLRDRINAGSAVYVCPPSG